MSSVLPFDIAVEIIDIIGETKNTSLLKRLSLVSHSFHQSCSKYLFATVELHDAKRSIPSSMKGFVKLVKGRPDVIKYIRKLKYHHLTENKNDNVDHLVSPILSNFLPPISCLNSLIITGSYALRMDWNTLDSSLSSAFLHLIHLSTINHIGLAFIRNFPLCCLASSVNLHRLNMFCITYLEPRGEDGSLEIVQSETAPKIHEFHTSGTQMTRLLHAKRHDGRPSFDFKDLRRLSMSFACSEDEWSIRYLLQNAKLLEKLHLNLCRGGSLVGLGDILSSSTRTLKLLGLKVPLYRVLLPRQPLVGLCVELETMAGRDMLEALSFEVILLLPETEDSIGSIIQEVEKLLVKPGWSALRQVFIKILLGRSREDRADLVETLQSLPDKYLSRLSNLESLAFNYSVV